VGIKEELRQGVIPESIEETAAIEGVQPEVLARDIADGYTVLLKNEIRATARPVAVGRGLRTKINANIGTSNAYPSVEEEVNKCRIAIDSGADTVMDLSVGGDITSVRKAILEVAGVPVGTVPIYQAAAWAIETKGNIVDMSADDMFEAIEDQCADGVDFITVHCGVTRKAIESLRTQKRVTDVVSRGGAFLTAWMLHNDRENPLFSEFDRLLDIAETYDVTLSLGDGMRPGCGADAGDEAQMEELRTLSVLAEAAKERDVQVMIEGPGHVPLDQIEEQVKMQKKLCKGAPFYVLGPLVTDVAPGYDEITAAIGGALAAVHGADFLCYVTPREHLGLPSADDVKRGVIASRIAAHAADIVKGIPGAKEWDRRMSVARKALDWETQIEQAIDSDTARRMFDRRHLSDKDACTMCGEFCAMKIVSEHLGAEEDMRC
jgi:phosphomethylpyrimidine synthase